jgi:hypothetical protein
VDALLKTENAADVRSPRDAKANLAEFYSHFKLDNVLPQADSLKADPAADTTYA